MSEYDYDLFVIGAGSGGVRAARLAAQLGKRVGIAEEHRVGGTCVIRGCVPKKLLVYAGQLGKAIEDAAGFGWTVEGKRFDWPALIANKDREIDRLNGIYIQNLERAGVELFQSRAEIAGPHTIRLTADNREVTAGTILIATGGRPFVPDVPGKEHAITSNEAFHLNKLPERIVIVGGGYIGVEFAAIFNALGSTVTLVYRGETLLRGFDDDLRTGIMEQMQKSGIEMCLCADIEEITKTAGGLRAACTGGAVYDADVVMFATGRQPNTEGLGLEALGVERGWNGYVVVDDYSRSSVPHIYAIGDVTHRVALTPVAIDEGARFVETAFKANPTEVDHDYIPTAVFSQPEIGTVGLTEAQARERQTGVDIYMSKFRPMKHTLSGRDEQMLMKLIVDRVSDAVLGVHIMGPDAAEMVQIAAIPLRMGATKADFDATMALHPSAAEELVTMREKRPDPEPAAQAAE
ncbi:MAG: glutathione-disulfide reductase [Alphaproteobacteria bacterium]|jgi:glutathione reductase (NADPH)|nr:glutathione-disulfide reductase [Alphaproteobacteria bacterium]